MAHQVQEAYIVAATRTPIGRSHRGFFRNTRPDDLLATTLKAALAQLWRYSAELFEDDAIDEQAAASGLGPKWSELQADWRAEMAALLAAVKLPVPADSVYRSTGRRGVHSEHMGFILAEMQYLQRAFPGGVW